MKVSQTNSFVLHQAMKASGIRIVSALPESWLGSLIRMIGDDPDMTLVHVSKEEEGVGISAGAHFAGVKSAMLVPNHGFLASVNGIVSLAHLYKIPLMMFIAYRGTFGDRYPWHTPGGSVTEPLLEALRVPYVSLDVARNLDQRVRDAQMLAEASLLPVALLLKHELMTED
jgi:sulfopyruvate decarboxylase subunit alpha